MSSRSSYNGVCKLRKEVGGVRWTNARMKSRESVPLVGRPSRPYIESGGQVTHKERFS